MTRPPSARRARSGPDLRPAGRDGGFTLVELLIAIVLSGVIAGVTVGAMATSLNVASSTSEEVADSTDAGLISSFLFRDAQAAGAIDPATAGADARYGVATAASATDAVAGWGGCQQPGAFVARFSWIDAHSVGDRQPAVATYSLDAQRQLTRRLCQNGAASDLVLGHRITDASARCLPDAACADLGGTVALTLSGSGVRAPFTYTLTASLRVDARSLPSAAGSTAVALLALGDTGSSAPCPNLILDRVAPVSVVGDVVVGADCGADPVHGDQTLLHATGTVSAVAGVTDPFASVVAPAQTCGTGPNPTPVGDHSSVKAAVVYPRPVALNGAVQFQPGTYIFCSGLDIGVGSTVVGSDVFLVIAGGTLSVSDRASVHLSATRSGDHANLVVWVTTSQTVAISAGSTSGSFDGYVYAPTSQVVVDGTGSMNIGGVVAQGVVLRGSAALRFGLPVPTMTISPSALPGGQAGVAYPTATLTAAGGSAPYRWSAGGLPAGLVVDATTGILSGTPTASGPFDVVVTASDATAATTSTTYSVTITPPLTVSAPSALPAGEVGVAYPASVASSSGGTAPLVWSASGLPAGLTIDPSSGTITGTPSQDGSYSTVVTVADAVGATATRPYTVTIAAAVAITTSSLPAGQSGVAYPSTAVASSGGMAPLGWTATGLPAGLTISPSGLISGTPTESGSFAVVVQVVDGLNAAASAGYTLVVNAPLGVGTTALPNGQVDAQYSPTTLTPSGGTAPFTWSTTGLPAGLVLDSASGVLSGTPTAAGTSNVVVTVVDATGAASSAAYGLVVNPRLAVTGPASPPTAQAGVAYPATTITASGGTAPYAWRATGLPPGMTLNGSTGVVSGTPTTAGSYPATVTVTDSIGATTSVTYTVVVKPPLTVVTAALPDTQLGASYSVTLTASGGTTPYMWTATGLPAGLTMASSGVVSGMSSAAGTFSVVARVADAAGAGTTRGYTLSVSTVPAGCPSAPAGWRAEYFANIALTAPAKLCRDDAAINFDWGTGAPATGIGADNFSVRWTRSQDFTAGTYIFSIGSDDGSRLYIDGVRVFDRWVDQAAPNPTPTVSQNLTEGNHDIVLEYYERGGSASATLSWTRNVPVTCPSSPSGWVGQYYANNSLTGSPVLCRDDATINIDWGAGSPAANIPVDNFSVRWTRTSTFAAGTYRFALGSDDGGRLYVDGTLVLDKWSDHGYPNPVPSTNVTLTAGSHTLVVEYYERGGQARAVFTQSP